MYERHDIFKLSEDPGKIKAGSVLISEPFTRDAYFKKSVVYLVEHNNFGSVGFILNKPVKVSLSDMVKNFPDIETNVSIGGPVETNSVHFIHNLGTKIPDAKHITGNIYWGGNFKKLIQLANLGLIENTRVKFFVGYSGWKLDQLTDEIKNNYWKISNLKDDDILGNDPRIWYNTVENLGEKFKLWLNVPENPAWN